MHFRKIIDLKDDGTKKIIRVEFFDAANHPIIELKPVYISSKTYSNYVIRIHYQ